MSVPSPLPSTIPIGSQFSSGSDVYVFESLGIIHTFIRYTGPVFGYVGYVKHLLTGKIFKDFEVSASQIDWEKLNTIEDETDTKRSEDIKNEIKHCVWCSEPLGTNQTTFYCEIGKVKCKEYYFALIDRMAVDCRKPEDAFEFEKESVKRWVDNNLIKK